MDRCKRNGWRFYRCRVLCDGEIGINRLGQAKWYPAAARINSTWLTRTEAANTLRLERNFENTNPKRSS